MFFFLYSSVPLNYQSHCNPQHQGSLPQLHHMVTLLLTGNVFLKTESSCVFLWLATQMNSNLPKACFTKPCPKTRQLSSPLSEFKIRFCGRSMQSMYWTCYFFFWQLILFEVFSRYYSHTHQCNSCSWWSQQTLKSLRLHLTHTLVVN